MIGTFLSEVNPIIKGCKFGPKRVSSLWHQWHYTKLPTRLKETVMTKSGYLQAVTRTRSRCSRAKPHTVVGELNALQKTTSSFYFLSSIEGHVRFNMKDQTRINLSLVLSLEPSREEFPEESLRGILNRTFSEHSSSTPWNLTQPLTLKPLCAYAGLSFFNR